MLSLENSGKVSYAQCGALNVGVPKISCIKPHSSTVNREIDRVVTHEIFRYLVNTLLCHFHNTANKTLFLLTLKLSESRDKSATFQNTHWFKQFTKKRRFPGTLRGFYESTLVAAKLNLADVERCECFSHQRFMLSGLGLMSDLD